MSASINSIPIKHNPDEEVEWDPFLKSNTAFSVNLLARLCNVGLQPSTVVAGQLVGSGFALEPVVQEQIRGYLQNLSRVESYGQALRFGFEDASLIKNLADLEHGTTCLALCACLAVSYDSLYAAKVLRELFQARKLPAHLSPPLYQWQTLVKLCAGTLSTSNFPNLVEELISQAIPCPTPSCYEPTCCTALAEALSELADISRGMRTNVSIAGGLDCLWLAAIAEWLFCLNVDITSSGQKVHGYSNPEGKPAQVTILFEKDTQVSLAPACHILAHGDAVDEASHAKWTPFLGGCSPWDTILSTTFGAEFTVLLQEPLLSHFATRLFLASEDAETIYNRGVGDDVHALPLPERYYPSSLAGQSLLEFAARRLPELTPAVNHIVAHEPHSQNRDDADREIKRSCACTSCRRDNGCKVGTDSRENSEELQYCRLAVVDTILLLLRLLTALEVDESIHPRATGLTMLYRKKKKGLRGSLPTTALAVFGGTEAMNSCWEVRYGYYSESILAVALDGICIFPTLFQGMDVPPERAVRYRVIPGHIACEGSIRSEILTLNPPNNRKKLVERGDISYELVVRETGYPDSIRAAFRVYCSAEADEEGYIQITDLIGRIVDTLTKPVGCHSLCNYWNFPHHPRETLSFRSVDGEDTEPQHEERFPFTGGWCLIGNNNKLIFPLPESACSLDIYVLCASLPSLYFSLSRRVNPSLTFVDATCLSCIVRFAWSKASAYSYSSAPEPGVQVGFRHLKETGGFTDENYSITRIQHSDSILEDALTSDNFSTMQFMLDRRYDIDFKDVGGRTALHRAAASGHNGRLTALLCAGADINTQSVITPSDWGRCPRTILDHAIHNGKLSTANLLLSSYATHIPQENIRSALRRAIRVDDTVVANLVLNHGAEPGPTADTPSDHFPLYWAIGYHHLDMVALLLSHGADPNVGDGRRPPLSYAAQCGTEEIIKMLLDSGADIQQDELLWKYRTLWSTHRHDNYDVMTLLVTRGAVW